MRGDQVNSLDAACSWCGRLMPSHALSSMSRTLLQGAAALCPITGVVVPVRPAWQPVSLWSVLSSCTSMAQKPVGASAAVFGVKVGNVLMLKSARAMPVRLGG